MADSTCDGAVIEAEAGGEPDGRSSTGARGCGAAAGAAGAAGAPGDAWPSGGAVSRGIVPIDSVMAIPVLGSALALVAGGAVVGFCAGGAESPHAAIVSTRNTGRETEDDRIVRDRNVRRNRGQAGISRRSRSRRR